MENREFCEKMSCFGRFSELKTSETDLFLREADFFVRTFFGSKCGLIFENAPVSYPEWV